MSPAYSKLMVSLAVLLSLTAAAEAPRGEVIIRTRDGHLVAGKIISETAKGYLLSTAAGTTVIAFTAIADLQPVGAPVTALTPPPPPPPLTSAPASAYERPPRPLEAPVPAAAPLDAVAPPATMVTEHQVTDWLEPRQGLHFGVGAMISPLPFTLSLMAKAHLTYGFGRFGIDLSPRIGVTGNTTTAASLGLGFGIDSQFRFAILSFLSVGVGIDLGVELSAYSGFRAGPSLTFADITLGDRGQHRLSLWASFPILFTADVTYSSGYSSSGDSYPRYSTSSAPLTMFTLGYAFMF